MDLEKLEVRVRVIGRYRSAFERQIGESIWLNSYLREGIVILNSKNEYNRCKIPRLGMELRSEEALEEFKEKQEEQRRRYELQKLKEKLRYGGKQQKYKKRRVHIIEEEEKERNEEERIERSGRESREEELELVREERLIRAIKMKRLNCSLNLDNRVLKRKLKIWRKLTDGMKRVTIERVNKEIIKRVPEKMPKKVEVSSVIQVR